MFRSPVIVDLGKRPGQLRIGDREAVHAQIAPMEQPRQFGNGGALQTKAHVELVFAVRAGAQQTARAELAEALRSAIGAGGRAGETDHHIAVFVRDRCPRRRR